MKKAENLKNYRLKYKRYYGIDFDSSYDVHHIDFDRTNNDISNLILLPKKLHQRYHNLLLQLHWLTNISGLKVCRFNTTYTADALKELGEVLSDINKWVVMKNFHDLERGRKYGTQF